MSQKRMAAILTGCTIPLWHGRRNGAVPPAVHHPVTFFRFIVLESGQPGIQMAVENMGRSSMLIAEVSQQVVVLNCSGELGSFDEVAVTLRSAD